MRFTHGLRATSLAAVVALAGLSALSSPVAAIDPAPAPSPTATPTAPSAGLDTTAAATPSPTPDVAITAAVVTAVSVSPAPIAPATETVAAVPAAKPNLGALVAKIALSERGKRYAYGASGPRAFDCSGLVLYAYRRAGLAASIHGGHSARGMYRWARAHGLTSRSHPRVGDIVVYGRGSHVGIYIGNGLVVSALNRRQGIRVTRLHALRTSFTAFIHPRY